MYMSEYLVIQWVPIVPTYVFLFWRHLLLLLLLKCFLIFVKIIKHILTKYIFILFSSKDKQTLHLLWSILDWSEFRNLAHVHLVKAILGNAQEECTAVLKDSCQDNKDYLSSCGVVDNHNERDECES